MLEKGKISPYQLFCIMFNFLVGSAIVVQSMGVAGRESWISLMLAIGAGVVMVWVTTNLAVRFPKMTLIEYAQVLFGKVIGKIIGVFYLWYFLHLGALVLRNFGEFLTIEIMPDTPLWFFHLTLVLVAMIAVYSGIEVMGRLSELVFPLIASLIILTISLLNLSGVMELKNLFPLLEHGIANVLKGYFALAAFPYEEAILITMVFPFVNSVANTKKAAVWGIVAAGAILLIALTQVIAIFGENMANLTFPRFAAIKFISVGEFVDRVDPVVLAIWITGGLVKIGMCLYAFVLGLAQILGLKSYKPLIIPSAVLMVVLSILVYENTFEMLYFAANIYPTYAFPFQVVFPVLMLVLASLKSRGKKSRRRPAGFN